MRETGLGFLLVAGGGALGASARHALNLLTAALVPSRVPFGTLAANALGCLLAGIAVYFVAERATLSEQHRLLIITGFLGGLTTFSAFAIETLSLARERALPAAALNIALNVGLSLAAVSVGWFLARSLAN
jgi:CrcB protein